MYGYYLSLAWRGFRRQSWFVVLIVLILGAGTGLFTTTCSLLVVLAGNPIPGKDQRLLSVRIGGTTQDGEPVEMMSSDLVKAVRKVLPEARVVATTSGFGSIESGDRNARVSEIVRFSDAPFFELFDVPFLKGRAWTAGEDAQGASVAVIGRSLADLLYKTSDVVGRSIVVGGARYRVIGVLDDWQPVPRYYDLSAGAYTPAEQVFLPLSGIGKMDDDFQMSRMCPMEQAETPPGKLIDSLCAWLNVWVLIDRTGQRAQAESRIAGLLQRWRAQEDWPVSQSDARVENVSELLKHKGIVPGGAKLGVLLALGFLLLCSINATGLLLARCLSRSHEIGVRRALGAARRDIMLQFMVEAGMLGLAGSLAGIAFSVLGISVTRQLPEYYMRLAEFSFPMLVLALITSLLIGLGAGLLPAWRASMVEPALQVKVD